jgi:murein L,D-transpeptidase YafK
MQRRNILLGGVALAALGGCSFGTPGTKFRSYDGPEVTFIVVNKSSRRMFLLHHDQILRSYGINLGFAPVGHKVQEGDGRTPEGVYVIDRINPNSAFHLSLGISYPNDADRAAARAIGKKPGGDIFIHGQKTPGKKDKKDWTWGCISVTNAEMEEIFAMVRRGTPIAINP